MARVIEIEGKTIDEALYHGLDQLALTIDEVDMEVLDYGSKGFMGGDKIQATMVFEKII